MARFSSGISARLSGPESGDERSGRRSTKFGSSKLAQRERDHITRHYLPPGAPHLAGVHECGPMGERGARSRVQAVGWCRLPSWPRPAACSRTLACPGRRSLTDGRACSQPSTVRFAHHVILVSSPSTPANATARSSCLPTARPGPASSAWCCHHPPRLQARDQPPPLQKPHFRERRGSPPIGAFEGEAVCPGVVRSGPRRPQRSPTRTSVRAFIERHAGRQRLRRPATPRTVKKCSRPRTCSRAPRRRRNRRRSPRRCRSRTARHRRCRCTGYHRTSS